MTDGTGPSVYAYWPLAGGGQTVAGGGQLQEITRPGAVNPASYAIHLDYDVLGRIYRRSIGGAANVETLAFDKGRLVGVTNNLGMFTYRYEGETDRLAGVDYPNGQGTAYQYWPAAQDFRLEQIKNLGVPAAPGGAAGTLSRFDYTYDPQGRIATWEQRDSSRPTGRGWTFGYDDADQLRSGSLKDLATNGLLKTLGYEYNTAGNRTQHTEDGAASPIATNGFNQAFPKHDSGWIEIRGEVSQQAHVRIEGKQVQGTGLPATGDAPSGFGFRAMVPATKGENSYRLSGTELNPPDGKAQTFNRTLRVTVPETGITSYDANGNMVNNGAGQIYEWDAENRLITIWYAGTARWTKFQYDGLSRRVGTWESGQPDEFRESLWYGTSIAEERALDGTVLRRHFDQGVQEVAGPHAGNYYYTMDHLGSIREMTDASGAVRARYDYDPYVNRVKVGGDLEAGKGFTGFAVHALSGLQLTLYRGYDASLGRWLSRDPIEEEGGINLYGYLQNRPIQNRDPLGLADENQVHFHRDGVRVESEVLGKGARNNVQMTINKEKFVFRTDLGRFVRHKDGVPMARKAMKELLQNPKIKKGSRETNSLGSDRGCG